MKKILFAITGLTIGGAERVLVDLANRLADEYDITILTLYGKGKLEKEVSYKVKLINYYKNSYDEMDPIKKKMISVKLASTCIMPKGFDTYVAFLEGPMTRQVAKIKDKNAKKIAWVHNDISKVFGEGISAKTKNKIDEEVYRKFDKIVFVSEENKKDFINTYGKYFDTCIIKNYLDYKKVIEKSNEEIKPFKNENTPTLVTVARLVEQKGIGRFIRIHKKIINNGIKNNVYIIGNGPLKDSLKKQINDNNVKDTFKLLGEKKNPYPYIKQADYFCLLSNFEGYGMVLDEAKILNKKIIITNTAAKEAVKDYSNAYILKNDENSIYEGLKEILTSNNKRTKNDKTDEKNYCFDYENYYAEIIKKIKKIL